MKGFLAIGLGCGRGSIVSRYAIAKRAAKVTPADFPLGTMTANLLGCLMIYFFWSYFEQIHISHEFRLILFTTFFSALLQKTCHKKQESWRLF